MLLGSFPWLSQKGTFLPSVFYHSSLGSRSGFAWFGAQHPLEDGQDGSLQRASGKKVINPALQSWASRILSTTAAECHHQSFFLLQPQSNENVIMPLAASLDPLVVCLECLSFPAALTGQAPPAAW